jgi:hypothetical protein
VFSSWTRHVPEIGSSAVKTNDMPKIESMFTLGVVHCLMGCVDARLHTEGDFEGAGVPGECGLEEREEFGGDLDGTNEEGEENGCKHAGDEPEKLHDLAVAERM